MQQTYCILSKKYYLYIIRNKLNEKIMKTITQNNDYKIRSNGSSTYFVMSGDDCVLATSSKIKANNCYNKMLKCAGINE